MSFCLNRRKSDKLRQYYVHYYGINAENDIVPTPFTKEGKICSAFFMIFLKSLLKYVKHVCITPGKTNVI